MEDPSIVRSIRESEIQRHQCYSYEVMLKNTFYRIDHHPWGQTVEIFGIKSPTNGRCCEEHTICDAVLTDDCVVRFSKVQVILFTGGCCCIVIPILVCIIIIIIAIAFFQLSHHDGASNVHTTTIGV